MTAAAHSLPPARPVKKERFFMQELTAEAAISCKVFSRILSMKFLCVFMQKLTDLCLITHVKRKLARGKEKIPPKWRDFGVRGLFFGIDTVRFELENFEF